MTCVVAIKEADRVIMAADSAGAAEHSIEIRKDQKIFCLQNEFLIGFTTSFRMGQILRNYLFLPDNSSNLDPFTYISTIFVDSVRVLLKNHGFTTVRENTESAGTFLVSYRRNLYRVDSDYQVAETYDNYQAIGSGRDLALGSLFSTKELTSEERLTKALEAAASFNSYVRAPFYSKVI